MNLKQKLEYHYNSFDKTKISPDPLEFLHQYKCKNDIEAIGFIASVFAYGNVKQINSSINKLVKIAGNKPYNFIKNFSSDDEVLIDFKHRFYTADDVVYLLKVMKILYEQFGSIKDFFILHYDEKETTLIKPITDLSVYFLSHTKMHKQKKITHGIKFMFPLPLKGSACKRINLFLRWMIRNDELDTGLWNEIPPNKLLIPVDTHIARISRSLGLTKRKDVSWQMAVEITEKLKKYDPFDPVKYDFALCHIGIRKLKF